MSPTFRHYRTGLVPAIVIFLVSGCTTHKSFSPAINAAHRQGLSATEPLLVAVIDGRTSTEEVSEEAAADQLLSDLQAIYGTAVERREFFSGIPENRVGLKIRIRTLGSNFGSRVVSQTAVGQAYNETDLAGTSSWGPLVASVRERQNVLATGVVTEGWWIGTAWLDVTIVDQRKDGGELRFPLIAEARKLNTLGYQSAEDATHEAWRKVSSDLLYVIDETLRKLR